MNNEEFEVYANGLQRPRRIDSLDKLSAEIKYVSSEWLKIADINEHDLRLREVDIYSALSNLELNEQWKIKNEDLATMFVCTADTRNVIEKVKSVFNIDNNSEGVVAAKQILDRIRFMDNAEK